MSVEKGFSHLELPENYRAPSQQEIEEGITSTGLEFKGKNVPWGIETAPVMLPENLKTELGHLGTSLACGFQLTRQMLTGGGKDQARAEGFVRSGVPESITQDPVLFSKRTPEVLRPDIVMTSRKDSSGEWQIAGKIAEVEARPGGTYMYPSLLEGYGLGKEEYMEAWAERFNSRPWGAIYPESWKLYRGELDAFGRDLENYGSESLGVNMLENMNGHDVNEFIDRAKGGYVCLFGDLGTWESTGRLDDVMKIANESSIISYNPMNYYLDTKATLSLMKQEWFLDKLDKQYGEGHAERLHEWLAESFVLTVMADQEMNLGEMIQQRKQWVLKRAGFDRDSTEARGLVMPGVSQEEFANTLQHALSGNDGPWVAQEFTKSRLPHDYYHPETGEVDRFAGATRLTPIYGAEGRRSMRMLGALSTGTYGSDKAHGGSGDKKVPGMSVMAPVVFGAESGVKYEKSKGRSSNK